MIEIPRKKVYMRLQRRNNFFVLLSFINLADFYLECAVASSVVYCSVSGCRDISHSLDGGL